MPGVDPIGFQHGEFLAGVVVQAHLRRHVLVGDGIDENARVVAEQAAQERPVGGVGAEAQDRERLSPVGDAQR